MTVGAPTTPPRNSRPLLGSPDAAGPGWVSEPRSDGVIFTQWASPGILIRLDWKYSTPPVVRIVSSTPAAEKCISLSLWAKSVSPDRVKPKLVGPSKLTVSEKCAVPFAAVAASARLTSWVALGPDLWLATTTKPTTPATTSTA